MIEQNMSAKIDSRSDTLTENVKASFKRALVMAAPTWTGVAPTETDIYSNNSPLRKFMGLK
jgi:hypothetical protein